MSTKQEWLTVKAQLDALDKQMDAATAVAIAPFKTRYDELEARLDEIEADCGELVGLCEFCSDPVWRGDRYSNDPVNGIISCEPCAPSYKDMATNPSSFLDDEGEYLTAETVRPIIDAHLAKGGSLDDKMVSA